MQYRSGLNHLLFIFLVSFFTLPASGQNKKGIEYSGFFDTYYFRGPVNFTAAGGVTSFQGDFCKLFGTCGLGYYTSIGASYQVWPRTYFGGEVSYMALQGTGNVSSSTYSFSNAGVQLDAFGRFLLLDKKVVRHSQLKHNPYRIRPYITSGVGVFYGMTSSFSGTYHVTDSTSTSFSGNATLPKYVLTIPLGFGFQIWFSHKVSIMPEATYRFAFTDGLDGVTALNSSGMDGFMTIGLKVQITPQAPRVKPKKRKLTPPEKYEGPKGTDYPRKTREKPKPKRYGNYNYNLPDENQQEQPQEQQEFPEEQPQEQQQQQQQQNDGGWDNNPQPQEQNNQQQQKQNDGWGW